MTTHEPVATARTSTRVKVLTPGHLYELAAHEDQSPQRVQFIEKRPEAPGSTTLVTVNDGTTNEAVLEMLIDRIRTLDSRHPCPENAEALAHLDAALNALESRTAKRLARGVEGTNAP